MYSGDGRSVVGASRSYTHDVILPSQAAVLWPGPPEAQGPGPGWARQPSPGSMPRSPSAWTPPGSDPGGWEVAVDEEGVADGGSAEGAGAEVGEAVLRLRGEGRSSGLVRQVGWSSRSLRTCSSPTSFRSTGFAT